MDPKRTAMDFIAIFAVTLVVSAIVTFLWNLLFHETGAVDWETSFRFAIILGIVLTWAEKRRNKGSGA